MQPQIISPSKQHRELINFVMEMTSAAYRIESPYCGFPEPIISDMQGDDAAKAELACVVASLNILYGKNPHSWHNLIEEGYFFTERARKKLKTSLNWIQASIVTVDHEAGKVGMPAIDSPSTAIAFSDRLLLFVLLPDSIMRTTT